MLSWNQYNLGGCMMSVSGAQKRATKKYNAKKYDRIELKVQKGEKDLMKIHAIKQGESLNSFINRAIQNQIKTDNGE